MQRLAAASLAGVITLSALAGCQAATDAHPTPGAPAASTTAGASASAAASGGQSPTGAGSSTPAATSQADGSELRKIAVTELSFSQPVTPITSVAMGNAIDPPLYTPGHPSAPIRVADKGVQPSATADDTVYVGCHTSATHGPEQYPCDALTRSVQPGYHVVATTDAGTLTYVVDKTRAIPYADFATDAETWDVVPKRLVFVMCDVLDGQPTHMNYVIYATLAA